MTLIACWLKETSVLKVGFRTKICQRGTKKEKISDVTQVFKGGAEVDKVLRVVWNHRTDELRF